MSHTPESAAAPALAAPDNFETSEAGRTGVLVSGDSFGEARRIRYAEICRENARKLKGKPRVGKMAAGPNHPGALRFHLVSPDGERFSFRNASQFVRDNPDLFESEDRRPDPRNKTCLAAHGLGTLRPTRKSVRLQWRGWMWDYKLSSPNTSSQRTRPLMPDNQATEATTQEQRPGSL